MLEKIIEDNKDERKWFSNGIEETNGFLAKETEECEFCDIKHLM